ncbi:MAG: hypothetical protein FWB85_06855 [Chitinispirillia bacterium]|nr:hypothetical protein [Chitinispirillia bacterium]MCL2241954.1 hypothetical protein [Chitinispirillia bacterium]
MSTLTIFSRKGTFRMMKKVTLFLLALLCSAALGDVITMQDGRTVENAAVLKIGTEEIEYRIGDRPTLYSVKKSDVAKITYGDGTEDLFDLPAKSDPATAGAAPDTPAAVKGPVMASVYVTGVNSMIGGTLSKAINTTLMKTGIYEGMESIDKHVSGTASDAQLINAGKQAGVGYVFAVNVAGQISVRIIDVGMSAVMAQVSLDGQITAVNATGIAKKIVDFILKEGPQPDPEIMALSETKTARGGGSDGYFTMTWLPVASPVYWAAGSLQAGWVWGKGKFFGFELVGGSIKDYLWEGQNDVAGLNLNLGNVYELPNEFKLVYGLSAGFWASASAMDAYGVNIYILAPFLRFRYQFVELSNKLLIGNGVSYQLGIGLHFEGTKRFR